MVIVKCINPEKIKLEVTIEYSVTEWQTLISHIEKASSNELLWDFVHTVREAIRQIQERSVFSVMQGERKE